MNADQQTFLCDSPTVRNADGVAKLKCAQVSEEVEMPVMQHDAVGKKSVLQKREKQAKGNRH